MYWWKLEITFVLANFIVVLNVNSLATEVTELIPVEYVDDNRSTSLNSAEIKNLTTELKKSNLVNRALKGNRITNKNYRSTYPVITKIPDYYPVFDSRENRLRMPFMISKVDIESNPSNAIPIIIPAAAQLTKPASRDKISKKKNLSKMAKSLILAAKTGDKKAANETVKATRSYSTTIPPSTRLKLFEMGGFCNSKTDGLYDDPEDCENFIICYADRTFRTKCAYGTMWNHIRKECDFPEKVDCERKPPTPEPTTVTTTTTTTKSTTLQMLPKLSYFTGIPNRKAVMKTDTNLASAIKTNILLTVIIVPLALFVIVIIIISVWYWNKKFKQERKQHELTRAINMDSKNENQSKDNHLLFTKISCGCYKKLASLAAYHKQLRPSFITACTRTSHGDRIRTHSNLTNSSSNMTTNNQTNSEVKKESNTNVGNENNCGVGSGGFIVPDMGISGIDDCQIASESHVTLSSHFEENNWDYNFATRGLYLSQPWVRGRYTHTLGSDSAATSTVLTLDPTCTDTVGCDPNTKVVEIYGNGETAGSDTDGYYA